MGLLWVPCTCVALSSQVCQLLPVISCYMCEVFMVVEFVKWPNSVQFVHSFSKIQPPSKHFVAHTLCVWRYSDTVIYPLGTPFPYNVNTCYEWICSSACTETLHVLCGCTPKIKVIAGMCTHSLVGMLSGDVNELTLTPCQGYWQNCASSEKQLASSGCVTFARVWYMWTPHAEESLVLSNATWCMREVRPVHHILHVYICMHEAWSWCHHPKQHLSCSMQWKCTLLMGGKKGDLLETLIPTLLGEYVHALRHAQHILGR